MSEIERQTGRFSLIATVTAAIPTLVAGLVLAASDPAGEGQSPERFVFGGTYADLSLHQRALVDDWFGRFNAAVGTDLRPEQAYDEIPISVRTTFEAVTHALSNSVLTSAAGDSLCTALDLIEKLDHVRGRVPGARGDLQFRIYVQLQPEALATLEACREFTRCHDNTVFHKNYPLNYRQGKGAPSIQFSMTRDGRHADIDVDYRSSFFAVALFDGHLTAANSDVRAGNNVERHNNRWSGLTSWWRNLFGFSHAESTAPADIGVAALVVPGLPRAGKGHIEDAVHDYLSSWLVDGEPQQALSYVSEQAFDCLSPEEPGEIVDREIALARKFEHMLEANGALGRVETLSSVVRPIELQDPRLRPVKQTHAGLFLLYEVPASAAPDYGCGEQTRAEPKETVGYEEKKSGRYAVSFVLHRPERVGFPVLQIWQKDSGIWRIESFRLQADPGWAAIPDVRPDHAAREDDIVRIDGDPEVIQVTTEALESWLLHRDMARSMGLMADESLDCANLELHAGESTLSSAAELRARIESGMERLSNGIGQPNELEDVIQSVRPMNSEVRLVTHPRETAFSLLAIPDHIGVTMDCRREWEDEQSEPPAEGEEIYGNHYLVVFQFRPKAGEGPAVHKLHWAREDGQWRIMAFHTLVD